MPIHHSYRLIVIVEGIVQSYAITVSIMITPTTETNNPAEGGLPAIGEVWTVKHEDRGPFVYIVIANDVDVKFKMCCPATGYLFEPMYYMPMQMFLLKAWKKKWGELLARPKPGHTQF